MSVFDKLNFLLTPNAYKQGKLFALKGQDVDFERLSDATRVNQNGLIENVGVDVPRLDYLNGSCPDILVEPQATNNIRQSNGFSNTTFWDIRDAVPSFNTNETLSPDGTNNSTKLTTQALSTRYEIVEEDAIIETGEVYTHSFFVKKGTHRFVQLFTFGEANQFANFDIENVVKGNIGANTISSDIKEYSNGWVRISQTFTTSNTNVRIALIIVGSLTSARRPNFSGTGNESIYIFGAQGDKGNKSFSYTPTENTALTRSADAPQPIAVPSETTHIVEKLSDGSLNVIDSLIPLDYTPDFGRYKFIAFGENLTSNDLTALENYGL